MATLEIESLPTELIVLIAKHVKASGYGLARLAVISRQWQTHIESVVFSKLSICASDLQRLSHMLSPARFLALRELNYRIDDIPFEEPDDITSVRISVNTCAIYSDAFTQSIRNLFTMLRNKCDYDNACVSHPGITLRLRNSPFVGKGSMYLLADHDGGEDSQDAEEVSDSGEESDTVQYSEDEDSVASDETDYDEYGPESKLTRAWLRLTGEDLPVVPVVTRFSNQDQLDTRAKRLFQMVWPQSWSAITSCLPNVEVIDIYANDDERRDRAGRLSARDGIGRSLHSLPSSVAKVSLMYPGRAPANHFRRPPRLTDDRLEYVSFSRELGLFSQRLVSLVIHDATLSFIEFFACSAQNDWPCLEKLDVSQAQPASPDGTWYFAMSPSEPREEYARNSIRSLRSLRNIVGDEKELPAMMDRPLELFHIAIVPAEFDGIYLTAANAIKRMPRLLTLTINFELQGEFGGPGIHEFVYEAGNPPESKILSKSSSADIKVEWTIVPSIELREEVLAAWRRVASARGASIDLYLIDNPDDLYDYRLIG